MQQRIPLTFNLHLFILQKGSCNGPEGKSTHLQLFECPWIEDCQLSLASMMFKWQPLPSKWLSHSLISEQVASTAVLSICARSILDLCAQYSGFVRAVFWICARSILDFCARARSFQFFWKLRRAVFRFLETWSLRIQTRLLRRLLRRFQLSAEHPVRKLTEGWRAGRTTAGWKAQPLPCRCLSTPTSTSLQGRSALRFEKSLCVLHAIILFVSRLHLKRCLSSSASWWTRRPIRICRWTGRSLRNGRLRPNGVRYVSSAQHD